MDFPDLDQAVTDLATRTAQEAATAVAVPLVDASVAVATAAATVAARAIADAGKAEAILATVAIAQESKIEAIAAAQAIADAAAANISATVQALIDKAVVDAVAGLPKPAYIPDPYRKRAPHDMDSRAVAQDAIPSASQMTLTANAIEKLALTGEPQEYHGKYWIDRTINLQGGVPGASSRRVEFNQSAFMVAGVVPESNFTEIISQGDRTIGLSGLNDPADNLPTGETTRAIFDVTGCSRSTFSGQIVIDGGGKRLAGITACNRNGEANADNLGTTWDDIIVKRCGWGIVGQPRYGQDRNFYAGAFVGNVIKRLRVESTVAVPLLFGGNTCDDTHIGELNIINGVGSRSYLFGVSLVCGTVYVAGASQTDFVFDIKKASLHCGSLYGEGWLAAPIWARAASLVTGCMRYGNGSITRFSKKAMIYNDDVSGGGRLTADPDCGVGGDMLALVALKARTGSKRCYDVLQAYSETVAKPFSVEPGNGIGADVLTSQTADGCAKWTMGGTGAVPTLARVSG